MSNSHHLYEKIILDHNRAPRNFGKLPSPDIIVEASNPLCGDTFQIYLQLDGNVIQALHFEGNGCAISKASASLMTTLLKGKTKSEAQNLLESFQTMLNSEPTESMEESELGELVAFSEVRKFPMRIKCAALTWRALDSVLSSDESCTHPTK
ncbi:MAG: SUF system NifU family Fe-S cluster assembly protein [Candidatus Hydrogenedentes bacterium]|nr:SUF system NifU family Fe-S cluster assembly protein [Candidatus Hydrogenedentota bacterium]